MRLKPDIDRVRERMLAFWECQMADRALIAVVAPNKPGANISQFVNDTDCCGPDALVRYWTDAETIRRVNVQKLENTYFGGEAMPILFQNHGTSGHCNYFGAKPVYSRDTVWFDPALDSLDEANIRYREDVLERHLATARYLARHAGDDYLVGMPDSTGTLDALGHLYGSERLLLAMTEDPEAVRRASAIVDRGWADSNERFYQISRENCAGGAHAWMHLWAPGRVQHMQCDLSVMISPAMFEAFAVPELERQLAWLDFAVYHFDGAEQARHLDHLLGLSKLRAVQWTAVAGQPSAKHFLPILKRIQRAGKGLVLMTPAEDVPELLENLSAAGLYLHCEARTPEEARALVRYVEGHSKERR